MVSTSVLWTGSSIRRYFNCNLSVFSSVIELSTSGLLFDSEKGKKYLSISYESNVKSIH